MQVNEILNGQLVEVKFGKSIIVGIIEKYEYASLCHTLTMKIGMLKSGFSGGTATVEIYNMDDVRPYKDDDGS